ncbi:hypothetical protein [Macrococcus animalis]|uniref:hypothetical protein n=1 Tax=Macrococcus animalis TaxID=3395467 RepID=UPI0039BE3968
MNNSISFKEWKLNLDITGDYRVLTSDDALTIIDKEHDVVALFIFTNNRVEIASSSYCARISFAVDTKEIFIRQHIEK